MRVLVGLSNSIYVALRRGMEVLRRLKEKACLRALLPKWAAFYTEWNQSEESKKKIGDMRNHLQQRVGGAGLSKLVEGLQADLTGAKAAHEKPACLGRMGQFFGLRVENATQGYEWADETAIEAAFLAARKALRSYQIAIEERQEAVSKPGVIQRAIDSMKRKPAKDELPAAHALGQMQGLLAEL